MSAKDRILNLFEENGDLSVKEITDKSFVSKQMVHRVLNDLLQEQAIIKLGRSPKTIYRLTSKEKKVATVALADQKQSEFLKQQFLLITETGELKEGADGFELWCKQRKLPFQKTVDEFISTCSRYLNYRNENGFIDGMEKLRSTKGYDQIHLDGLFYLDFYAIERFGKTKLGTLLHYAKQGQSKFLMKRLMDEIGTRPSKLCEILKVDAVLFVPPTIRREVQLMKFIQTHSNLSLPVVQIKKISGIIPVPQKSLTKLEERITNAQNTFSINETRVFKHILLIDDAVGSGATVNEIAGKIKQKGVAKKVSALAITGSFKGFDVITDV
jgi:DNA-binding MarR family transcriptional regulator